VSNTHNPFRQDLLQNIYRIFIKLLNNFTESSFGSAIALVLHQRSSRVCTPPREPCTKREVWGALSRGWDIPLRAKAKA